MVDNYNGNRLSILHFFYPDNLFMLNYLVQDGLT